MTREELVHYKPRHGLLRKQLIAGAVIVCFVLSGCAGLRQRREAVEVSGFLSDYSQLKKDEKYPAYLIYINPAANWSKYNAVLIDSVSLYGSAPKLSAEDRQYLAGIMYNSLNDTLAKHFAIATAPGPNVLRLRAALTEAQGSKVVLNTVTSVIPQLRILTTAGGMAGDTSVLVGEAAGEIEILDSATNERLAAGVDRQTGTKALIRGGSKFSKWGDVQEACNYWAENVDKFLVQNGVRQAAAARR